MSDLAGWWRAGTQRLYGERKLVRLVLLALVLTAAFGIVSPHAFLTSINAQTIALSLPEIALLGLATMVAMLTGGIDLSIVSTANLAALTVAGLFAATGTQDATGARGVGLTIAFIAAGLIAGLVAGSLNSLLVAVVGVTPILATLGTMLLYNGLAISLTGGKAFFGMPEAFLALGNDTVAGVPYSFAALAVVAVALAVMLRRTAFGTRLVLVGAGPEAARYSGIATRGVLVRTYLLTGLLAALAGIVIASRSASAAPDYGASYVLLAIVIAVLGGTNPDGGYGSVLGVVLAALVLLELSSGMNIAGMSAFAYQIAQGAILIAVMVWDALASRRGRANRRGDIPPSPAVVAGAVGADVAGAGTVGAADVGAASRAVSSAPSVAAPDPLVHESAQVPAPEQPAGHGPQAELGHPAGSPAQIGPALPSEPGRFALDAQEPAAPAGMATLGGGAWRLASRARRGETPPIPPLAANSGPVTSPVRPSRTPSPPSYPTPARPTPRTTQGENGP